MKKCWKLSLSHAFDVGWTCLQRVVLFSCSHPHLLTSPSPPSSLPPHPPPLPSCLDNITAYYFSYFHPSLCPYRPVSQAVMCDLELSLPLRVLGVGVQWLVYRDVTGGVTLNKPSSPPPPSSPSRPCTVRPGNPWGCESWVAERWCQLRCG